MYMYQARSQSNHFEIDGATMTVKKEAMPAQITSATEYFEAATNLDEFCRESGRFTLARGGAHGLGGLYQGQSERGAVSVRKAVLELWDSAMEFIESDAAGQFVAVDVGDSSPYSDVHAMLHVMGLFQFGTDKETSGES